MINLIGKGIRVAGAEIQLAHTDVVVLILVLVLVLHRVCWGGGERTGSSFRYYI